MIPGKSIRRHLAPPALALTLAAAVLFVANPPPAEAGGKVRVVTTTSVLGDIVREVGGDRVDVKSLEPPGRDVHFYEPTPSDIVRLSRADVFMHGGLDLELWRGPLVEASTNPKVMPGGPGEIDAAQGISLLEVPAGGLSRAQGDVHIYGNPHFWLDPANLGIIAANAAAKLETVDPEHADVYRRNLADFQARLREAIPRWKATLAPFAGKPVTAYHNSWPYFAKAFDLRIDTFLEPKPNIAPSGAHLEKLEAEMKQQGIRAILVEPFQHRAYADQVAAATGAEVCLVSTMPGGVPGTDDLFSWMDHLTKTLAAALGGGAGEAAR